MSFVCDICHKKTVYGISQTHKRGVAGKRWRKRAPKTNRLFKPNLQRVTLKVAGTVKKMRICTKCLKSIKKFGKIRSYSNIAVA